MTNEIYAEMPDDLYKDSGNMSDSGWFKVKDIRDFADLTHAARLRCKSEQARLAALWGYVRADAAQAIIDFGKVGTAGPFPVVNGRVSLPDATMQDLARMLRPTYEAQQAVPKASPVESASAAKGAIMSAAHDFRDAHISGSMNLKRSAHADLEAAVDNALAAQAAPQQEAQERVYLVNIGEVRNGLEMYERHEKPVPLADCEVLYTAPQPAVAQVSERELRERCKVLWLVEPEDCTVLEAYDRGWADRATLAAQGGE